MKNFRGSALAAGVGTPESAPHELLGSSLHFYLRFKHRNCFGSRSVLTDPSGFFSDDLYRDTRDTLERGCDVIVEKIQKQLI